MVNEPTLPPGKISNLSDSQETILNSLTLVSGCISTVCSGTIIYLIMVKSKRKSPLNRMLVGLSASDIVFSITYSIIPFLLPADSSTRVWAKGTDATCSFGGFIVQLSFATGWYNGFLSFYYLATVRFGVPPSTFARRFEPWIHILSIGWNLGTATIGLIFDYYREVEIGQACWVDGEIPKGCNADDSCVGMLIAWIFTGIWAALFFVALVVNNLLVYCHVRRTFSRSRFRTLSDSQISYENRLKTVATQGFLFVASYLLSYTWTFAARILDAYGAIQPAREAQYFPFFVCQHFFLPLQGFFNLLIYYVRPKYLARREEYPDESVYSSLKALASGGLLAPVGSEFNTSFNRSRSFRRGISSWRQDTSRRGGKRSRDSLSGRRLSGGSLHTFGLGTSQHIRNIAAMTAGGQDLNASSHRNLEDKTEVKSGDTDEDDQVRNDNRKEKEYEEYQVSLKEEDSGDYREEKQRKPTRKPSSVMADYESSFSNSSLDHIGDEILSGSSECASLAESLVDIISDHRKESVLSTSSRTQHA